MKKIVTCFLLLYGISCTIQAPNDLSESIKDLDNLSVYSLETLPEREIDFSREQVFPSSEDVLIGNILDFEVDNQGRVFIVDDQQLSVLVFNSDGTFITALGREGRGPSEFQEMTTVTANSTYLYVYDDTQKRINVFSLDSLSLSRTIPVNSGIVDRVEGLYSFLSKLYSLNNHPLIARYDYVSIEEASPESIQYRYYHLNESGEQVPEVILQEPGIEYLIGEFEGVNFSLGASFVRSTLMAVSKTGMIYTAWSNDFLIKVYDSEGNYLRAIYYPFEKSELNQESYIQQVDVNSSMNQIYENAVYPDSWPALHYMFVDDENRIWVSTISDDENNYDWWILSSEGELLATFQWPGERLSRSVHNLESIKVKDGYLYIREGSSVNGFEIVRYRIEETD